MVYSVGYLEWQPLVTELEEWAGRAAMLGEESERVGELRRVLLVKTAAGL